MSNLGKKYRSLVLCFVLMVLGASLAGVSKTLSAGRMVTQTSGPLLFRIEKPQSKECAQPCLVVEASLTNTGNDPLAIDTVALRYVIEVRKSIILPTGGSERTITKRGDYGPGQYDESTYRVLKAGETYRTTFNLPLTEKFFHDKGTYRIKFTYGQFRDYSFQAVELFNGTVDSNELAFNCRIKKTKPLRRDCN